MFNCMHRLIHSSYFISRVWKEDMCNLRTRTSASSIAYVLLLIFVEFFLYIHGLGPLTLLKGHRAHQAGHPDFGLSSTTSSSSTSP